jgi:enoyl-[acyl-carrier protein] reductase II
VRGRRISRDVVDGILTTRVTRQLGITYPIVQAGMGYLARYELVAAVSNAGGLGVVGSTGNLTPDELAAEITAVHTRTSRPFAVNFLFPRPDASEAGRRLQDALRSNVATAIELGVPIIGAGLGVPPPDVMRQCKKAGVIVMCTIGATRHAVKAQEAGVDLLIAQGWEAGGHNSGVASMALLPQVHQIARIPFLAAGGIASGAGLVAALALGASGVYMGTAFATASEAQAHQHYKEAILRSEDTSTVISRAHSGKPARMLANSFTRYYEAHPEEVRPFPEQLHLAESRAVAVRLEGKVDEGAAPAGQIGGYLQAQETASHIVERIMREADEVLGRDIHAR